MRTTLQGCYYIPFLYSDVRDSNADTGELIYNNWVSTSMMRNLVENNLTLCNSSLKKIQ